MRILVCISSVPDTTSKINFTADQSAFDKNGIQWIINPHDEFVLTKAIQLQASEGANVTVVSVGEVNCEPVLRKALAIGANDAIRVNLEPKDSYSTAKELASVIQNGDYDMVFCGKESLDYNGGAVPAMVAQLLDYSFVNGVVDLEFKNNKALVTREIEGGKETMEIEIPLVIAGQKGLVNERDLIIPNMRGIMNARTKSLSIVESISEEINTEAIKFEGVMPRGVVKMIASDNLDELVKLLHEEARVI